MFLTLWQILCLCVKIRIWKAWKSWKTFYMFVRLFATFIFKCFSVNPTNFCDSSYLQHYPFLYTLWTSANYKILIIWKLCVFSFLKYVPTCITSKGINILCKSKLSLIRQLWISVNKSWITTQKIWQKSLISKSLFLFFLTFATYAAML